MSSAISDLASNLIAMYFTSQPTSLSRYALDSYNYFVTKEIPELIFNQNPITIFKEPLGDKSEGRYVYKTEIFFGGEVDKPENLKLMFAYPIVTLDEGKTTRRMFPMEARLRNLTYAATVLVDLRIRITMTSLVPGSGSGGVQAQYAEQVIFDVTKPSYELFQLPIMLRSALCATNTTEMPRLQNLGECQYDQGGYFIIDGSEKVLITSEETAFNSIYAGRKPAADQKISSYATCSSLNPKNKQIRRSALFVSRSTGAVRMSLPFIRGDVPVFIVFRALGIQSDKDIISMIIPDLESQEGKLLEHHLIACVHDAFPVTDNYLAIQFLRTLTKGFINETVLDVLINHLFTHVPNSFIAKAQFLGEMVRQLLRVEVGLEPNTDRDDTRNKRYLTAGTLVRELFTEVWNAWIKATVLTIDREYNNNKQFYAGTQFTNIFSDGNIAKMISGFALTDGLMRGFRGKWGVDTKKMRKGVCQPLARISYLDSMSHIRRVSLDFELKSPGPRRLHPSQCGYFCISEVPSGFSIGITKNASIMTIFSLAEPTASLFSFLYGKCGVIPVDKASSYKRQNYCKIQVNGGTIGFIADPEALVRILKLCKQTACFSPTTSISFNRPSRTVRIFMDEGRPCRPVWILRDGAISPLSARMNEVGWRGLVRGVLAETAGREFFDTGFYDPFPSENDIRVYEERLAPFASAIEYIDPYETNEAYISWYGANDLVKEHTHCEIHPSTMFGFVGSMIPFANYNQSPRNQLSCSQSKQGIGYYSTQYANRFDTYGTQMCYAEAPICRTLYYELIADGNMCYGTNVIVALASYDGYNMDDGILFNRSSVERGMFHHLSYKSYDAVEEKDPMTDAITRIGNPSKITNWMALRPGADYSQLDDDGIIREGALVSSSTVLVGRYTTFHSTGQIKDASLMPGVFIEGRVDKVSVIHQANGYKLVHVRLFQLRVPELGDKFSNRHGQKGTIGMLRASYDMPRTASGIVPDIVVNPHSIPSRMTMAQIMEQITSKAGAVHGAKMNATTFTNSDNLAEIMGSLLEEAGFEKNGEEIMYSPFTGKQYTSTIFMTPQYFMRLRHLVADKLNARGVGRKEQRTHQPTGGRGNEGGLRIGEMERDVLIGHGIADMFHERMMKCSDETEFVICNSCGQIPIYNSEDNLYICPSCDGPIKFVGATPETLEPLRPLIRSRTTFTPVKMPYAFKLLNQELSSFMNIGMRFVVEKQAARLRDETLDWMAVIGTDEAKMDIQPLPEFRPIELPSSDAVDGATGPPVEELQVLVEKEEPVEPLPPNPLVEAERQRADEAEAALAEAQAAATEGPETIQIDLPADGSAPTGPAGEIRQRGGAVNGKQQIVIVLPPGSGGTRSPGRPATGRATGYIPKKKGVALQRMLGEQEGGGMEIGEGVDASEMNIGAGSEKKNDGKGPVNIRVSKEGAEVEEE